jgi:sugar lactone lactonase YvrE
LHVTNAPVEIFRGATFIEGTRWHEGRWFFSDMYADAVCSVAEDGTDRRVEMQVPQPSGIGWLPDGTLLAVAMVERKVYSQAPGGEPAVMADLSSYCPAWMNDMVTDEHGRVWVSQIGFDVMGGEAPQDAPVIRIDPDGSVSIAAEDLMCPNGMLISPDGKTFVVAEWTGARYSAFTLTEDGELTDRRILCQLAPTPTSEDAAEFMAELKGSPDGCAMDAEGHVWGADLVGGRMVRVSPAGEIVEEIPAPEGLSYVTCAIGGSDGHTMVIAAAPGFDEETRRVSDDAVLLATTVPAARGGRP